MKVCELAGGKGIGIGCRGRAESGACGEAARPSPQSPADWGEGQGHDHVFPFKYASRRIARKNTQRPGV